MGKTVAAIVGVVAAVAIAIVAPYLAPALVGALASIGVTVSVAVATAIIGAALSIGLSLAFRALGVGRPPSAKDAIGPPVVFRQTISNSFIVYGKRRVGGLLVFFHSRQSGDDHFRYFVVAVAGHRCKGVVTWMLNDEAVTVGSISGGLAPVTSGKYAGAAWLGFQRGLASETANATFVSECGGNWTTNHKGNGVAAIYAKFKLTDDVIQAGMPNITAVIEGRDEVLDTRDATLKYTRNAELVAYDWMNTAREEGGFGAYPDEMPDDAWVNAQANVCDEMVDSEERYAFDVVMTTGAAPSEVRDAMIVNMAGTYAYSGGKHLIRPGYWVPPSVTLSEDDLAGPIQVSPFLTSDTAANEVQGTFVNPADNYQAAPLATQSVGGSDIRQLEVDLGFITSFNRGNRILAIMLKRAQCEKTVVWPMNIVGLKVDAMTMVQCDSARYGLSNYAFQVANWALSADWGTVIQLREENAEIYDDPTPTTPGTPPTVVQPTEPLQTVTATQTALRNTYPQGLTTAGHDAGGGTGAYISLSAFTMRYPGGDVAIAAPANITGAAYSTTYFIFCDVTGPGDSAPTFGATTAYATALNSATHPFRIFLNQTVTTPASGGGTSGGTGGGGGYGGGGDIP